MSASAVTEREYKFDVDADFDPPDLRPVVGRTVRLPEIEHRTVYLDTADRRLWNRGITLRFRSTVIAGGLPGVAVGGAGGGPPRPAGQWTLKLPLDGNGEGDRTGVSERSELTWDGDRLDVPAPVRRVLAGVVRREPLIEIAELSAVRRRLLLQAPDGSEAWGEVDDDLVSVTGGPNVGRRFRQIEVELVDGQDPPAGQVEAVVEQMTRAGAAPGGRSKLGAALGLAAPPARPAPPSGGSARKKVRLAEAVSAVLTSDLDSVLECDTRLRRAAEDGQEPGVELIHQARVRFRRARSHVRTFAPVLDPVWVTHVKRDLKSVGQALGRVRDADVLVERLDAHENPEDRDGLEELAHLVAADRALVASELVTLMGGSAYLDLIDRLAAAAGSPPLYSALEQTPAGLAAGPVMHDLLARRWRRTTREIAGLGADPDARHLHQVRIRAKRLRYAAEAAEPFVGRDARRVGKRAKALQKVLGDVRDSTGSASWLRQLASHPSITPTAAFVAGRMAGQEEARAALLTADWSRSARQLAGKRLRKTFA